LSESKSEFSSGSKFTASNSLSHYRTNISRSESSELRSGFSFSFN
jgi:hypothetical protein